MMNIKICGKAFSFDVNNIVNGYLFYKGNRSALVAASVSEVNMLPDQWFTGKE